jgi:hypothetical protein
MPNHLSILGIVHTFFSVIAVLIAIYSLLRYGKIDPETNEGTLYIALTAITCLTALPIMKTGHISAGHPLAIIILVLLPIGVYAKSISFLGRGAIYVQTIVMSATFFFSMIPAIVETLTRVPISHPLAPDPNAPIVKMALTTLVLLFFAGIIYQVIKIKVRKKELQTPDSSINLS